MTSFEIGDMVVRKAPKGHHRFGLVINHIEHEYKILWINNDPLWSDGWTTGHFLERNNYKKLSPGEPYENFID